MILCKKIISLSMVLIMMFSMFAFFSIETSAASLNKKYDCIEYNYVGKKAGKSTYNIEYYYSVKNGKKLTIDCFWNTEKLNNQRFAGLRLKDYLRFDVHVIDATTGRVVDYWYGLKPGASFKVFSEVPSIKRKSYTVKVTSYLSNYRTYVNSDLAGVSTCLKYKIK